ncbi:MAG: peptide chain release factor N(5)-glutamine methyltransferase [Gammaproteobacteria bacterium]|nr:MAG: peptide chain release factor N(5)-glutamine methyltransferase [Gammaproteobacteria bacterium]
MHTSGELLASALAALGSEPSSARLDAEVLLAHTLDKPRARLRGWPDDPVAANQAARYRELIARRAGGEPVAYLTGMREFWSLSLEVTPETLIPRPETERLVEVALASLADGQSLLVADLGTGSGAVAAAIASERPACHVIATDVCPRALAVATRNMARLALDNVTLRRGNWCDALRGERYALIVANPPYVASGDTHLTRGDVLFEPRLALSAGDDGLNAIRDITESAAAHLLPGAALILEHGHDQGPAVRGLFRRHDYKKVRGYQDLAGNDRLVVGFM